MVKAPEAGRVKTRLARGIGVTEALRFYRSATSALARRVANDLRWQTHLAVAPDRALHHPTWPAHLPRRSQGGGDLGQRMQKVVEELSPGPVVIIGSDIPGITPRLVAGAFRELGRADIVLGPAPDGGYWLIGFKRSPRIPKVLENVRWSHPETLNDTLRNTAGLRVRQIESLEDVDEPTDMTAFAGSTGRLILPAAIYHLICNSASCPSTTDKTARA